MNATHLLHTLHALHENRTMLPATDHPVLYSFRRCPYAMRARLALWAAGVRIEHREVLLRAKPAHLLAISPKGTVPVLWFAPTPERPEGAVIEQSLDIMRWALQQADPLGWWPATEPACADAWALVAHNDGPFKRQLDRYKYPNRFGPEVGTGDRDLAAVWLHTLDGRLQVQPFLAGTRWGLADAAIAPFVRQYAHTDRMWFAQQPWGHLMQWLGAFETSAAWEAIMHKHATWAEDGADAAQIAPA